MSRYVISAEYGALIEGYNGTAAELASLVALPAWTCAQEERSAMLLEERDEWRACMDRCPMFVQFGGRANG